MRFDGPLHKGRLLRRYKRFLADVELADGSVVKAHCANPGSMKTCLRDGARVWLSAAPGKNRKLPWTWELIYIGKSKIFVNPVRANRLVAEAIESGAIAELAGYDGLRREVPWGKSRIDMLLEGGRRPCRCYVEVKNVTLALGGGRSAFPDSVTERGRKHLEELVRIRRRGHRAVLFFCASRDDTRQVEPADEIDPAYGTALRRAAKAGVELLAYRVRITARRVDLVERVPVVLP